MTAGPPVAVVTGGTHGIGRHTLDLLGRDGWSVALCSRNGDEARAVAATVAADLGVRTFGAEVDVRSFEAVRSFASEVAETLGPPRGVVANAAILGPVGPLHEIDMAAWADTVAVDVVGVANTWAAFAALLVERELAGSLITLSGGGVGGPNTAPALSAYTTSKAAIAGLTETVAKELEAHGIRVNAIAPGAIATRFTEPVVAAGPALAGVALYEQTVRQRAEPDALDHFDAVLRLLLDETAPFISGRLLSARWDDLAVVRAAPPTASLFQLRRIDGVLFESAAKDS